MGLFARAKTFYHHTYLTGYPILGTSGTAMMVSPKVVVGSIILWLTGESHPEDCECEICTYRQGAEAIVQANTQARYDRLISAYSPCDRVLAQSPACMLDADVISGDEPWYWAQYLVDNFGEPFDDPYVWDHVISRLDDLDVEKAGVFLFDLVRAKCELGVPETVNLLESWDGDPDAPEDAWEGLFYLASLQLVGSEN